jgi:hypothetical protein
MPSYRDNRDPYPGAGIKLNILDLYPNMMSDAIDAFNQSRQMWLEKQKFEEEKRTTGVKEVREKFGVVADLLGTRQAAVQEPGMFSKISGVSPERVGPLALGAPPSQQEMVQEALRGMSPEERQIAVRAMSNVPVDPLIAAGRKFSPTEEFKQSLSIPGLGARTSQLASQMGFELPAGFETPGDMQKRFEEARLGLEGKRVTAEEGAARTRDKQLGVTAQTALIGQFVPAEGVDQKQFGQSLTNIATALVSGTIASAEDMANVQPASAFAARLKQTDQLTPEAETAMEALKAAASLFSAAGRKGPKATLGKEQTEALREVVLTAAKYLNDSPALKARQDTSSLAGLIDSYAKALNIDRSVAEIYATTAPSEATAQALDNDLQARGIDRRDLAGIRLGLQRAASGGIEIEGQLFDYPGYIDLIRTSYEIDTSSPELPDRVKGQAISGPEGRAKQQFEAIVSRQTPISQEGEVTKQIALTLNLSQGEVEILIATARARRALKATGKFAADVGKAGVRKVKEALSPRQRALEILSTQEE